MGRNWLGNKQKTFWDCFHAGEKARLTPMKVGLLSDTHNHLPETRRALDLLLEHGAEHLLHCGDVGDDVLSLLSATCLAHGIQAHVAIGNCDSVPDVRFAPQPKGVEYGSAPEFVLSGKRCVLVHGDQPHRLAHLVNSGDLDFVFTGHTHRAADQRIGSTRVLNPGSPVRPRGGPPSVALIDLDSGEASWLTL